MRIQNIDGTDYRLPNGLDGFKRDMFVNLINWKWAAGIKAPGHHEHKGELIPYDAILPEDNALRAKMPHIYPSSVKHLLAHHERNPFRLLTNPHARAYPTFRNNPGSFGEGAQSRSVRIGSCFFRGAVW